MGMKNCIILGSGRCGTSMVAGALAKAGYYMGHGLSILPSESHPKGQFESPEINGINEELLAQIIPEKPNLFGLGKWFFHRQLNQGQRWLARLSVGTEIPSPHDIIREIQRVTQKEPYCFKDTRFPYTLPVWKPFLRNTVFICVFRDPVSTAMSILREIKRHTYLRNVFITFRQTLEVWTLKYQHILKIHRREEEWLFLHYNQVFKKESLDRLEVFTDAYVDRSFPDISLRRFVSSHPGPNEAQKLYQQLCRLAGYEDGIAIR